MRKFDVQIALEGIAEAKSTWATAITNFNADVELVMRRLLNEAAVNFMSAEEVAKASGLTVKRVRVLMRDHGLNPRDGKRLLAKRAAETLSNNAALLGVEPHEMDLMSPLAYLPAGPKFPETAAERGVKELPEDHDEMVRKQAVVDFVSTMTVLFRAHSGDAINEDMLLACVEFDVDPAAFYDEEDEDAIRALRAAVASAKVMSEVATA